MKSKLPKSVYLHQCKYHVGIFSKTYRKKFYIGAFDTIQEAVTARDKFVVDNYHDITKGYLPRHITFIRGKFQAQFSFSNKTCYIGVYNDLNEAIKATDNFIDSLK